MQVTMKQLRQHRACHSGYNRLVRAIQGKGFTKEDEDRESYIRHRHDAAIPLEFIAESNGIEDAIWATRCVAGFDRDLRLFAVWCARQMQHLMKDDRSIAALDVSERFANGEATAEELDAAGGAAWAAARGAAWDAAWASARAAQKDMLIKMCRGEAPWQIGV